MTMTVNKCKMIKDAEHDWWLGGGYIELQERKEYNIEGLSDKEGLGVGIHFVFRQEIIRWFN